MRAKEERAGLVSKDMLSAVVEGQKAKVAHLRTPSHTFAHRTRTSRSHAEHHTTLHATPATAASPPPFTTPSPHPPPHLATPRATYNRATHFAPPPSAPPTSQVGKQTLDLEALTFENGGHLMANKRCHLPAGSFRTQRKGYEEVHVPALKATPFEDNEKIVTVAEIPEWAQPAFGGTKALNRVQSRVYPCAMFSAENMLICAPTGAGKTNVAMLCMLHEIGMHRNKTTGEVDLDAFKIVYVAPMKALVQEMVLNFRNRLEPFGVTVNELTGDSTLTKEQINDTQVHCAPSRRPCHAARAQALRALAPAPPAHPPPTSNPPYPTPHIQPLTSNPPSHTPIPTTPPSSILHPPPCFAAHHHDAGEVGHHHAQERRPHVHTARAAGHHRRDPPAARPPWPRAREHRGAHRAPDRDDAGDDPCRRPLGHPAQLRGRRHLPARQA